MLTHDEVERRLAEARKRWAESGETEDTETEGPAPTPETEEVRRHPERVAGHISYNYICPNEECTARRRSVRDPKFLQALLTGESLIAPCGTCDTHVVVSLVPPQPGIVNV